MTVSGTVEDRLARQQIILPQPAAAAANYVPFVRDGRFLFISGQLPIADGAIVVSGRLGETVSLDRGIEAARLCAINILAQAKAACGSLDQVHQLVRLGGFVASAADFTDQPKVINGASDLMVELFGDRGRHARAAVGVNVLPMNAAVEIEALFTLEPDS